MPAQGPPVEIHLLGVFQVSRGSQVLNEDEWPRKRAASLLKKLAFEGRLLKDQAVDYLWPDSDPASAYNNLYKTIHELRRTLNDKLGTGAAESIFDYEDGILRLNPDAWVDVKEFERLCKSSPGVRGDQRISDLEKALELYRGDLLPDDLYAEWTLLPRKSLYRRQRDARLDLAALHRESGGYTRAIDLLLPVLAHDLADEPVHRELMLLYTLSGMRHLALNQYQVCVDALSSELGAAPEEETTALYRQILSGKLVPQVSTARLPTSPSPLPTEDKPRPTFVGRERELSTLFAHLEAAAAGEGRIVFITGEAGQGKTSLMSEFAYHAVDEIPGLVAAAGASQAVIGIADPYLPFRDLVAMLRGDWQRPWIGSDISINQIERLLAVAPQTDQLISTSFPELLDILAHSSRQPRQELQPPNQYQGQVFSQMAQFLRALAQNQPLLLLLDDLQWSDSASAGLLFYLGRQLVNSPILIVGAYRPSEVHQDDHNQHPLAPVVRELVRYRGDITVDLDASTPAEERRFIDAYVDSEANRLDATFRNAIYQRTRGQPLFTVELMRALQDQGDLQKNKDGMWTAAVDLDWAVLPARVEAVIARRIESLPQELRYLLAAASVEGESFSVEVIARFLSADKRSLLQMLSHELDRRYRLVREQGEWRLGGQSLTRYQFRHNLFQQYLYQQLSAGERRAIHREIASIMEDIGAAELEQLAGTLAQHYLAAGDPANAVPYLYRAGEAARRRVALVEAVKFFTSAVENWQAEDPLARAEVLKKLGESLLALGRADEAIERFSEANIFYVKAGNRTGMGAMHRLIGRSYYEQGERTRSLEYYHRALALLEDEPENGELARVISAIAQMHMSVNEYDEAIAWGERALSRARGSDAKDIIVHALTTIGTSLANKGETERGLPMLAESQQQAEALGLPHDAGRAYAGWGDALMTLERYDEARAVYERMLAYSHKVQASMFEGVAWMALGYLDWWAGRWRQAWSRRQSILKWMEDFTGASFAKVWAASLLGTIYNDLGQAEKAREVLIKYEAVARSANEPQTTIPLLGQLARCARSQEEQGNLVQEILSLADTVVFPPWETITALAFACGWLANSSAGDSRMLKLLERVHEQLQNWQSAASLHEMRAYVAFIRGEWGESYSNYKEAVRNWGALNRPYDQLRALTGLAKSISAARTGNPVEFRNVQSQTAAIIDRLSSELDSPEVKSAFLASPLAREIRTIQPLE